ncbi:MAG: polysaccharide biosynthesis/export family protein [Chlorogloeopsis fritschii C42_A2020_084]|uniref:polysaccharide biosynthesis/export family protein n=1 Tax=Chlorogloeopsis fritschii TaxID=1124 RepID=UPI001A0D0947|nr:polysaccharide biosynthesis/export family protein [Chlorogloeopsis fritschii]MBF2009426.1 polysaccharide biosynthesis/export family protein [Chlorogloeopsis fritschii C42_A2020_084]
MRAFSALYFFSLQVSVFLGNAAQPVVAQQTVPTLPSPVTAPVQLPAPPTSTEFVPSGVNNEQISPQLSRYILGPGDLVNIQVQRPPGQYRLGAGDVISVVVQRFPDLSFQAAINPEGNIIVPLLGTVSLQNLTLEQAQVKIRSLLNRYLVEPIVTLSLMSQRPDLNFSVAINPEGNVVLPQVGTVSLKGLTMAEAQEKIRLLLDRIVVDPVVNLSLVSARPVQITISGEVFRPGIYPMGSPTPRVADALLLSGGSTMMADLRQVQVRRHLIDGSVVAQTIDLYTPLQNGGTVPNLRLQDGDAIIVPRRELINDDTYDRNLVARSSLAQPQIKIRVLNYAAGGLVTQTLPNGSSFVDALAGLNPDTANLREIALVRFDPERGKPITQRLDGKKALSGDASQNVPLQDNDVIVVGRNLVGRITNLVSTITRPFFDVQTFIRFFETFGGGGSSK